MHITAKTDNQKRYCKAIHDHDIVICEGPAGCGKSFIATGMALELLEKKSDTYNRLIISRPMVPCTGYSNIGSLPGDLNEKCLPIFYPILSIIEKLLGVKTAKLLLEKKVIEFIPPDFLRGHTFENCIVILDEWQNSIPEETICAITRMGENTKYIISGDVNQKDIKTYSGLEILIDQLKRTDLAKHIVLTDADNQRHPKILKILKALDWKGNVY